MIKIKTEMYKDNCKYQYDKDKINQLSSYKKDHEVENDISRMIKEIYSGNVVNSSIEQYNIHANKLMNSKNQSTIIQYLLDNLSNLINVKINFVKNFREKLKISQKNISQIILSKISKGLRKIMMKILKTGINISKSS